MNKKGRYVLIKIVSVAIFMGYLLGLPLYGFPSEDWKKSIEDVYLKPGLDSWGDIFSSIFNRKEFGKSYALIIGIGDYRRGWPKLEAPYFDACRVRDFLKKDADFDYIITLTNSKATKQKINTLMEEYFPDRIKKNDRFLFYFSGHGTQRIIPGVTYPSGYLALRDCSEKSYGSMVNMWDIERWDRNLSYARHVLFILDCCFSGVAGLQRKSSLTDKKIERLSQYAHHLITSGTANEVSLSSLKRWNGSLFTDSFLKAASGHGDMISKDYKADGVVSLKELMKYIEDRIDEEGHKLKKQDPLSKWIKMSPQISDLRHDNEGEFFFITKKVKELKHKRLSENKILKSLSEETKSLLIREKKLKEDWIEWQSKMEKDFKKAKKYDDSKYSLSVQKKAWSDFLSLYAPVNPHGTRDEELIKIAVEKRNHLEETEVESLHKTKETVLVTKILFDGNTSIDSSTLEKVTDNYIKKELSLGEMSDLTDLITLTYQEKGYLLARAYLPEQEIKNGILKMAIVEGKIGKIYVVGASGNRAKLIKSYFNKQMEHGVIKESLLENAILALKNNENEDISVTLKEGGKPGEVDIELKAN